MASACLSNEFSHRVWQRAEAAREAEARRAAARAARAAERWEQAEGMRTRKRASDAQELAVEAAEKRRRASLGCAEEARAPVHGGVQTGPLYILGPAFNCLPPFLKRELAHVTMHSSG